MPAPTSPAPIAGDHADRRLVLQFLAGGAVVALLLGIGSALLIRDAARGEAERSARRSTQLVARAIVEPALAGLLSGDAASFERFDEVMRQRVIDSTTVRVKLWDADGRIVYSDRAALRGKRFDLEDEELGVIRDGGTVSEITNLQRPENRADRRFHRLLEVYTRVTAPDGSHLLYETYARDAAINRSGRAIWNRILPAAIGALLLLELVQVPLALRLARRLGARRREREQLLQAAVDASDLERRRIARDLHDGVVQHLAGVGLQLHAASREDDADPERAAMLADASAEVRQAIRELRTLLVDIYPPNLAELGLERALSDLVSELPARGIEPTLTIAPDSVPTDGPAQLVFRVAQEAIRNAERHARARRLEVELSAPTRSRIRLRVTDDGRGFDPDATRAEGHVGLLLLGDLVASSGGRLHVRSQPGNGTTVELDLDLADG